MMVEIVLVAVGTLLSVVLQYVHSMGNFGHSVPKWLLVILCIHDDDHDWRSESNSNGKVESSTSKTKVWGLILTDQSGLRRTHTR
jgi:hypothetical protein